MTISRSDLVDLLGQRDFRRYPDLDPRQREIRYRIGLPVGRVSVADGTPESELRVMTVFRHACAGEFYEEAPLVPTKTFKR